tara:strand:- start:2147 stop:3193 length:1047 start_codon:yes stop_codon:yes gene_type:complete
MSWSISWSWQAPSRISCIASVEGGIVISTGLELFMLESNGELRWSVKMPFKVHSMDYNNGILAALAAHGFYVISTVDGSMIHDGRSTYGGFTNVLCRPGGGWILSGKEGQMHLFSHEGVGIKRFETGRIRSLIGWLDREHILWQSSDGKLWCGRLGHNYAKRCLEDRSWSWVSRLDSGKLLLQTSSGEIWEGIPHPFGWDYIEKLQSDSLEPMEGIRCGDGWWVLGIEGHLYHISSTEGDKDTILGLDMNLGDLLSGPTLDTMVTATRNGLLRMWKAPQLALSERESRFKAAAEAALAKDWEERKSIFLRAQSAEDEGRLSLAVELYQALGRIEDVKRLLKRQKEGGE